MHIIILKSEQQQQQKKQFLINQHIETKLVYRFSFLFLILIGLTGMSLQQKSSFQMLHHDAI